MKKMAQIASADGRGVEPSSQEKCNEFFKAGNNLKAAALFAQAIKQDPNNAALYSLWFKGGGVGILYEGPCVLERKNPSAGALTNFEVLNFFQSRGASKEVAVTIAPSECKVFEYLNGTATSHHTTESMSVLIDKVKKCDLAKYEVLNIINLRRTLPVGVYTIVENCNVRWGEEGAQELVDMVAYLLPLPSRRGGP